MFSAPCLKMVEEKCERVRVGWSAGGALFHTLFRQPQAELRHPGAREALQPCHRLRPALQNRQRLRGTQERYATQNVVGSGQSSVSIGLQLLDILGLQKAIMYEVI